MAVFSTTRGAFTPLLTDDNWTLTCNGTFANVVAIGWGGRGTSSQTYRTRWVIPATEPSISTLTLTATKHSPGSSSSTTGIHGSWSTPAVLPADPSGLFAVDWNVHGGHGELFIAASAPWMINSRAGILKSVSCRNVQGTDANASSYWVMWEE